MPSDSWDRNGSDMLMRSLRTIHDTFGMYRGVPQRGGLSTRIPRSGQRGRNIVFTVQLFASACLHAHIGSPRMLRLRSIELLRLEGFAGHEPIVSLGVD